MMNLLETGKKVLNFFQNLRLKKVQLDKIMANDSQKPDHQVWDELLKKYVRVDGKVNYQGFQKDRAILKQYLEALSKNPPGKHFNDAEKLAYWINAYNAFTVELILQHYPLKSIKDIAVEIPLIDSPWRLRFFKIGGLDFDLDTIEHEIIRKEFDEPRIHFCVNCASFSCPKLRNEAFTADKLEFQLADQARYFIHNTEKNQLSPTALILSRIFKWYESDFTQKGSVRDFLQPYLEFELTPNIPIQYLEYNWNLNE